MTQFPQQTFLPAEQKTLLTATSYEMLAGVALAQLRRMRSMRPTPPGIVCGPITNGGLGSPEKNKAHFKLVIEEMMRRQKGHFFNQLLFEDALVRVRNLMAKQAPHVIHPKGAGNPTLEEFYRPIFESGLIGAAFFIKGWESSDGARFEHELFEQLGISIFHFDDRLQPTLVNRNAHLI